MPNPFPSTGASPSGGALRSLRAAAVASTVFGLAAGAHLVGGGTLPNLFLLTGIAVVLLAGCLLLAGRRFSLPVLAAVLGGGQFALHAVFGACSGAVSGVTSGAMLTVTSTGHHQEFAVGAVASNSLAPSAGMTFAHVAATVAAVALLGYGENLLWLVWAWLRPLVRVLLRLVRFVVPRVRVVVRVVPRPRSVVARRVRRRGPPRVSALATTF